MRACRTAGCAPSRAGFVAPAAALVAVGALCTVGCASGPRPVPRPTGEHCQFLAIEREATAGEVPAPVDSMALVLRVRPGGHAPTEAVVTVRREERDDLESRLRAHPDLLCAPEAGASGRYRVQLPGPGTEDDPPGPFDPAVSHDGPTPEGNAPAGP